MRVKRAKLYFQDISAGQFFLKDYHNSHNSHFSFMTLKHTTFSMNIFLKKTVSLGIYVIKYFHWAGSLKSWFVKCVKHRSETLSQQNKKYIHTRHANIPERLLYKDTFVFVI